jgi:hypothetical protein
MRGGPLPPFSNGSGHARTLDVEEHGGHEHQATGNPAKLSGYLGKSDAYDQAVTDFSVAYADQSERDHETLMTAVRAGKLEVLIERE